MHVTALAFAATAGGFLLVLAIVLPVAGILLSLVLGGRHAERIALVLMPAGVGVAIAIAVLLWRSGKPLVYGLGGLPPPLGIALRADGFSAVMLVTAAMVISAAGFFARANFGTPQGVTEARAPLAFWILASGRLGGVEHRLSWRRPVQSLCRPGASDLRRRAAGLSRWPSGNARRGTALSAFRAVRLCVLPPWRRFTLRGVWHARHRAPGRPNPTQSRPSGSQSV